MFAHMFRVLYFGETCPVIENDQNTWNCGSVGESYLESFSMFLTDGGWGFDGNRFRTHDKEYYLTFAFAFIVGVLLLNIVIAEVSNRFTDVQNDAEKAFWLHRLSLVQEIESLCFQMKRCASCPFFSISYCANRHIDDPNPHERTALQSQLSEPKQINYKIEGMERFSFLVPPSYREQERFQSNAELRCFTDWWFSTNSDAEKPTFIDRIYAFYWYSYMDEVIFPGKVFERIFLGFRYNKDISTEFPRYTLHVLFAKIVAWIVFVMHIFVAVIMLPLGGIFFGLLWPEAVKKWLFHGNIYSKEQSKNVSVQMEILLQQNRALQQQNRGLLEDNKILKSLLVGIKNERSLEADECVAS